MDIAYAGYLLFVIPGFVLIWTYRHFTKAKKIGEFEYAAWSFFWGAALFLVVIGIVTKFGYAPVPVPLNNPAAIIGSLVAISLALATVGAIPLAFIGAQISRMGLFKFVDKGLFKLLKKLSK